MNWNLPSLTDLYTNVLTYLKGRDEDNATMFRARTQTNLPSGTISWSETNQRWENWNGSTWESLSSQYAQNVLSATKLTTARTINGTSFDGTANITTTKWGNARTLTFSGGTTGNVSIDGSANSTITLSLVASEVLSKLLTVDGSGSGLDADLLDGYHGSSAGTASTYALRDSSGDITARLFKSTFAEQTTAPATTADICFRNDTNDNYMRFMSSGAFKSWLGNIGVPTTSVTLTDSVSTTSSTIGASATAVKTAYDLANSRLGDSGHSFATNGYQKLSNGLIIQWGDNTAAQPTSFPIAFPNACLNIQATQNLNGGEYDEVTVYIVNNTSFNLRTTNAGGSIFWMAIGY